MQYCIPHIKNIETEGQITFKSRNNIFIYFYGCVYTIILGSIQKENLVDFPNIHSCMC